MDPSNVHNDYAPNPYFISGPAPNAAGQQFGPPLPSGSMSPSGFINDVPPEFLTPVQQSLNDIHQLGNRLQTDTLLAGFFTSFEQDQFTANVRKKAVEALLSGLYGQRVLIGVLGEPSPVKNGPARNGQWPCSGPAYPAGQNAMPGAPITSPTFTNTSSVPDTLPPSASPPAGNPRLLQNGAITSTGLYTTPVSSPGVPSQPIDLTSEDEAASIGNPSTSHPTPASPASQNSPKTPGTASTTSTSPIVTSSPESRKRSRDSAAIDLDATSPSPQPPSKIPKGPLSNFRKDGPPILYEHRVDNYLVPYVRYYDARAGTVRDVSYAIYAAEYGELSVRWRELQGELEEMHRGRREMEGLISMEKGKKGRRGRAERNAYAAFGAVDAGTPAVTVAVTSDGNASTAPADDGKGSKAKATKKAKRGTAKGKKRESASVATATTTMTTTMTEESASSSPSSVASAAMPTPAQEDDIYISDDEFARICLEAWGDDSAV